MKKTISPSLSKYDIHDMRSMILGFPRQFPQGIAAAHDASLPAHKTAIERIIIAGMGGSALPGEILQLLINEDDPFKTPTDTYLHRDYGLPQRIDKKTLVICISYSGNTEETISAYKEARKRKLLVAVIASGGMLEKIAQREPLWVKLPDASLPPRLAVGMQFAALLALLERLDLIRPQSKKLEEAARTFSPETLEQQGKTIAQKTFSRIPVVYASRTNKALAYIMKIGFNENAKMMAFWNHVPECNHNEIVGFSDMHKDFIFFFLSDRSDNPGVQKRMRIMTGLAEKKHIPTKNLDITNTKMYNKIFNTVMLSQWISYYCALYKSVDPTPIHTVEEFKKKMRDK